MTVSQVAEVFGVPAGEVERVLLGRPRLKVGEAWISV
jgi:hypothetical protein